MSSHGRGRVPPRKLTVTSGKKRLVRSYQRLASPEAVLATSLADTHAASLGVSDHAARLDELGKLLGDIGQRIAIDVGEW